MSFLLERFEDLITVWNTEISHGCHLLETMIGIQEQRVDALYFYNQQTRSDWIHPALIPSFITQFPNALSLLIKKQTEEFECIHEQIKNVGKELERILRLMKTLFKDAVSKANNTIQDERDPFLISLSQAVGWIHDMMRGYELELYAKQDLIHSIPSLQSVSDFKILKATFTLSDHIDVPLQIMVHERVRLAKQN